MNNHLEYSNFNPETGYSIVTIANKYGHFSDVAKLHPSDEPYASEITGCEYAEYRAMIRCWKHRLKLNAAQKKIMQDYYNIISGMANFNPRDPAASKARRVMHDLDTEREEFKANIANLEKYIKDCDKYRDELHKIKNPESFVKDLLNKDNSL